VPVAQSLHAVNETTSLYFPYVQLSQKVEPTFELKVVDGQLKHSDEPFFALYVPATHFVHID
jgi:hypothetical protein